MMLIVMWELEEGGAGHRQRAENFLNKPQFKLV